MKLIVTLGATLPKYKHYYIIDDKKYFEFFSFLAVKKHFSIKDKDIIILGTQKTKDDLKDYISDYKLVVLPDDDIEFMFEKAVELIEKDTVLDITQSFRLISFAPFLAANVANTLGKSIDDILYAQVLDGKIPTKESCVFKFLSLKKYQDINDLTRVINSFIKSWYVEKIEIDEFNNIYEILLSISEKLLSNDINVINEIEELNNLIKVEKNIKFKFLKDYFELLQEEMNLIRNILLFEDYKKYFEFSKIYLKKNLLLQSLTYLFESVTAYLEYIADSKFLECKKNNRLVFKDNNNKYNWRNCLKSKFSRYGCGFKNMNRFVFRINNCKEFQLKLAKIDHLRNDSAHVFINGKKVDDMKNEIKELIDFFDGYFNG